jgi:hypothetical protein
MAEAESVESVGGIEYLFLSMGVSKAQCPCFGNDAGVIMLASVAVYSAAL